MGDIAQRQKREVMYDEEDNLWNPGDRDSRPAHSEHRIISEGNISHTEALELIRHRKTAVISSVSFWESGLIGHVHHYYAN